MNNKKHILICDDDQFIHESITLYLEREGYSYSSAYNGEDALKLFHDKRPDLIILDIMMPILSGIEVCREIRKTSDVPIIMLTAKSEEIDKIVALELGADDYITKPFSVRELFARVKAVLRRIQEPKTSDTGTIYLDGGLEISSENYEVRIHGNAIPFTPKEFEILHYLASNLGQVIERDKMRKKIWGDSSTDTRTLDTHIKKIRQKISVPDANWTLNTIYGIGYKLELNS